MKVTFVSCMPRPITEHMPHIRPSIYSLPAAEDKDFEILIIPDGIDPVYAGEGKHIERIEPGEVIAENLRNMICQSQLAIAEDAMPGIFWVPGELSKAELKLKHAKELEAARFMQLRWMRNLVKDADDIWAKFHQHRMISDLMRDAAGILKINREWLISTEDAEAVACPACGSDLPNPDVTICAACRTIIKPEEHAKKFKTLVGATK